MNDDEFRQRVAREVARTSTRTVERARKRATRGGRKGGKARAILGRHAAEVVLAVREAGRLRVEFRHSDNGRMPHRPSGKHQRKIRQRKEARSTV